MTIHTCSHPFLGLLRPGLVLVLAWMSVPPAAHAALPPGGFDDAVVSTPVTSVYQRPYTVDSPRLKAALASSKGDREESLITLAVSEYIYHREYRYFGRTMLTTSVTRYDPATGTYASLTTEVTVDPNGAVKTSSNTNAVPVNAEHRNYFCSSAGGLISEKVEVKSKCLVRHRVTRPARAPGVHAWNPIVVGMLFFTTPRSIDCNGTSRVGRTLPYEVYLKPRETREFPVQAAGFDNEACIDPLGTVFYFPPTELAGPNLPSNAK